MARVKSPRFCMNIAVASMQVAASDCPARKAWKDFGEIVEGHDGERLRPFLVTMSLTSRVRSLLDAAELDRDAPAGEIVDRLEAERIALGRQGS